VNPALPQQTGIGQNPLIPFLGRPMAGASLFALLDDIATCSTMSRC
jgi:hypothetical protein